MTTWLVTAYCACVLCCGPWALGLHHGVTSSAKYAEVGVTAACGPKLYGKVVWIEEVGVRWCEDTGSAIGRGRIDVYMSTHAKALAFAGGRGKARLRVKVIADWRVGR